MITESEIFSQVVSSKTGDMPPAVAEAVLAWRFPKKVESRINRLARRNQSGEITVEERCELEKYLRVGSFINIVQAQARRSLLEARGAK